MSSGFQSDFCLVESQWFSKCSAETSPKCCPDLHSCLRSTSSRESKDCDCCLLSFLHFRVMLLLHVQVLLVGSSSLVCSCFFHRMSDAFKRSFFLLGEPRDSLCSLPVCGSCSMWRLNMRCCLSLGQGNAMYTQIRYQCSSKELLSWPWVKRECRQHMSPTSGKRSPLFAVHFPSLSIPLMLCFDRKSVWEHRCYWFHLSSHLSNLDTMDLWK